MKKLFGSLNSKLFGKIFFSFMLILFVWMAVFYIGNQIIMNRAFNIYYNRLADNPPPELRQELEERGWRLVDQNSVRQRLFGAKLLEAVQKLFRQASNTAIRWATVMAFVIAIIASLIMASSLVQPAQAMSVAAQRIADGHYEERVLLPDTLPREAYDEWQDFAYQFNLMAESLEDTEMMRRRLIGDVAHEMRTPLTTVKGYLEGIQDGVIEANEDTFSRIYREADRLQHLVADLQELSRVESKSVAMELVALSPAQLLESTIERLKIQANEKHIRLEMNLPEGLPEVLGDDERIHQVLLNLTNNALHYTPQNGMITLGAADEGKVVHFTVADNGIGVEAEHLKHIFDRFYRVDKSRTRASGGSGIGLTISKHLVESMGGKIWAESAGAGKGSTFHFTLPKTS
ncbi:MAG: HAMP domain-containing histidine kinase [Anaerolineaceae bacterium]|nr:HAMP domain-containing histidine kinase [Anaerolineaceae bacterium]